MKKLEKNGEERDDLSKERLERVERPVPRKRKKEKKLERERSFLNGNAFLSVPVPTDFGQRTSLPLAASILYCT